MSVENILLRHFQIHDGAAEGLFSIKLFNGNGGMIYTKKHKSKDQGVFTKIEAIEMDWMWNIGRDSGSIRVPTVATEIWY